MKAPKHYPTLKTVHGERVASKDVLLLLHKKQPTQQQLARHKFGRKLRGLWLSSKRKKQVRHVDGRQRSTHGDGVVSRTHMVSFGAHTVGQ
jgi:hypothetical protein